MRFIVLILSFVLNISLFEALVTRKVHLTYPTELLAPPTGAVFSATASQDRLVCFGNDEYVAPTYRQTLFCMLPYFPGTPEYCNSVWGSRSIEIEVRGHIEFLKMSKLPRDTVSHVPTNDTHAVAVNTQELSATRWLQFSTPTGGSDSLKEILQVPAEPIYLCARSTDWQGRDAHFTVRFRHAYLRTRDKRRSNDQTVVHLLMVAAVTSAWFVPYLTSALAAVLAYEHGVKVMLTLFLVSASVVCLTPLMLTKHNRQLAKHYFSYFFTRMQAKDTRQQIKKRLPVFQALFFSSLLIVLGFSAVYLAYYGGWLEREGRNRCFQCILSAAISWFVFSLSRSFERFFRDWLWIAISVSLAHILDPHLNPQCHNEVVVATMVIAQCVRLMVPRFAQFEFVNALISTALPQLEGMSAKLRIPLPYQIYEHHSLRHLAVDDEHFSAVSVSVASTGGSPFQPTSTPGAALASFSHMATSTGDLAGALAGAGHSGSTANLRRASGSRASLAHLIEKQQQQVQPMQPLVDFIDEVVEGSICNEEGEEVGEDEEGSSEGEVEEGEEGEEGGVDGEWGAFRLSEVSGNGNSQEATGAERAALMDREDHLSGEYALDRAENDSTTPRAQSSAAAATAGWWRRTGGGADAEAVAPLWQRLLPTAERASGESEHAMKESTEIRNREALQRITGVDLGGLLSAITSTSNSINRQLLSAAVGSEEAVTETERRGKGRRDGGKKNENKAGTATTAITALQPAEEEGSSEMAENGSCALVGALPGTISVVGPLLVQEFSAGAGRNIKKTLWVPLATERAHLVRDLQRACDALQNAPVLCRLQAPLESSLTFSARVAHSSKLTAAVLEAQLGDALATHASTIVGLHGWHYKCVVRAEHVNQATVHLRVTAAPTPVRNVLNTLRDGEHLLRQLLVAQHCEQLSAVEVNHAPLRDLYRLRPSMHTVCCETVLRCPDAEVAQSLLQAHAMRSAYEVSAQIAHTVGAVLRAIGVEEEVSALLQCCEFSMHTTASGMGTENSSEQKQLMVRAEVPVLPDRDEQRNHHNGCTQALKCLLLGQDEDASRENGSLPTYVWDRSVGAVVLLAYVAYMISSAQSHNRANK